MNYGRSNAGRSRRSPRSLMVTTAQHGLCHQLFRKKKVLLVWRAFIRLKTFEIDISNDDFTLYFKISYNLVGRCG